MRNIVRDDLLLYAVTDRVIMGDRPLLALVEEAIQGGVTIVQLREKNLVYADFLEEAIGVRDLCREYGVPFIVNDNVDVACASDADGVHVGQNDMDLSEVRRRIGEKKIIGVSAQTVEQALVAEAGGADYLGVGAIFGTQTKIDAANVGVAMLSRICKAVKIPVVAIGGIAEENIKELEGSGVAGVAVISALFGQNDVRCTAKRLRETMENVR